MSMMCPESAELVTPPTERLADLLMLSHEPMFAWKLDGAIEFWNAGAERLYGFAPNETVGHSSHSLLQTKHPIELAELRSQLRNKRYWAGELRHLCKDGRKVIVDSRMQLLGDNTVLEVNRDVTQFKALLATLQESEQRLRSVAAIVESSDDAIVSKNLDGVITSWNKGAERIFGYSAEEAIGQPITIVIPHDRLDEEPAFLTRIRRGERIDHFETIRQQKNGSPNRRFIICVACQKRGGQDCWGGKDRKRYYRAEAKSGTDCHFGSGSRAPK
jgi:PAS domain S-box-containing protein